MNFMLFPLTPFPALLRLKLENFGEIVFMKQS